MIVLWILAGMGLYYLVASFVLLLTRRKPFIKFGDSLLAGTSVEIDPQEYACEKLHLHPVEPYKIKDVGSGLQVTFYLEKEIVAPKDCATV